jgi:hypothetical protein
MSKFVTDNGKSLRTVTGRLRVLWPGTKKWFTFLVILVVCVQNHEVTLGKGFGCVVAQIDVLTLHGQWEWKVCLQCWYCGETIRVSLCTVTSRRLVFQISNQLQQWFLLMRVDCCFFQQINGTSQLRQHYVMINMLWQSKRFVGQRPDRSFGSDRMSFVHASTASSYVKRSNGTSKNKHKCYNTLLSQK